MNIIPPTLMKWEVGQPVVPNFNLAEESDRVRDFQGKNLPLIIVKKDYSDILKSHVYYFEGNHRYGLWGFELLPFDSGITLEDCM